MPLVHLENVDLLYPVKVHARTTFKDFIVNRLFRRPLDRPRYLKALDQVSFRVDAGECVGVIGRNGAGKSTLRTVAGVYPSAGGTRAVDGKIASLFDIAAGFEWNATGWENIHLRAYLQGETPGSLRDKVQPIADFTELGDMLDAPLKCYSTGRIMLLSFAIAVCCEPEILVIDEFLSTGDLQVRKGGPPDDRDAARRSHRDDREPRFGVPTAILFTRTLARKGSDPRRWSRRVRHRGLHSSNARAIRA